MLPSPFVRIVGFLSATLITLVVFQAVALLGLPATPTAVAASTAGAHPSQASAGPGTRRELAAASGAAVQ